MTMTLATLATLESHPVIAILRGVTPGEVMAVAEVLVRTGFRVIEVPLNSPQALSSIEALAAALDPSVAVGAGTVLTLAEVDAATAAGARLVLSPNCDQAVIRRTVERGAASMPGVATPSEAFAALAAGAHALKIFPADVLGPASFKAWRAVLPPAAALYAVGGIESANMARFRKAGARGVGLGSALYTPGLPLDELEMRAQRMLAAWSDAGRADPPQ